MTTLPPTKKVRKNSLFPLFYDEISLVDSGAAGNAKVLIAKADTKLKTPEPKQKLKTKNFKQSGSSPKSSKSKTSNCDYCDRPTNSTGAKTGKSSKRAKNWSEEKHKRDSKGRMTTTPKESKEKYGKDGTTKAKLDAKCKSCQKKKKKSKGGGGMRLEQPQKLVKRNSSLSTWNSDAQLRAIMERK